MLRRYALADGDEFHLRSDLTAAGVGELRDRLTGQPPARPARGSEDAVKVAVVVDFQAVV